MRFVLLTLMILELAALLWWFRGGYLWIPIQVSLTLAGMLLGIEIADCRWRRRKMEVRDA